MSPARRKPPWGVLLAVGIMAPVAVAAVWFSFAREFNPHYQQRVTTPGMGELLVNLWTDPHPPEEGEVDLTVEVTGPAGGPILPPDSLVFRVARPGDPGVVEVPGSYSASGPGHGRVHVGSLDLDAPGPWQVEVRFSMGAAAGEAVFHLEETAR